MRYQCRGALMDAVAVDRSLIGALRDSGAVEKSSFTIW